MVRPGRSFLRRPYDLQATVTKPHNHIHPSAGIKLNLARWRTHIRQWNGVSFLCHLRLSSPSTSLESDVSGSWGAGAVWQHHWLQLAWESEQERQHNIATLNHRNLHGNLGTILARPDNPMQMRQPTVAVVHALANRSCRDLCTYYTCTCICTLFFFEAHFHFSLHVEHILGYLEAGLAPSTRRS